MELERIEQEANQIKESRAKEIIKDSNGKSQEVALRELKGTSLLEKDKESYLYSVKPQLKTLRKLIEHGTPTPVIADAMQIPHTALMRMKEDIPAIKEIFDLGELVRVQKAQNSIFQLAQSDVIEEQVVDREGNVVTLQKVVRPDFRAAKFIVENHMPETYNKKHIVEHHAGINSEALTDMLASMTPAQITQALKMSDTFIVEAEVVEDREEVEDSE